MKVITSKHTVKPGFHLANFDHDMDQFLAKPKRLMGRMSTQLHNHFVFLCRGLGVCCKWKPGFKPVTTTTTTNFESKQNDSREG